MSIDDGRFADYMKQLTQELFIKDTVDRRPQYINSTSWQRRKSLRADYGPKNSGQKGLIFLDEDVFKIPNYLLIGPYELSVLQVISNCQEGYMFFQGGSRSGKSSLMSYLEVFSDEIYKQPIDKQAAPKHSIDNMPLYTKILKIDLGEYQSGISERDNPNAKERKELLFDFFNMLFEMTVDRCQNLIEGASIFEDKFFELYKIYAKTKLSNDVFTTVIKKISSKIELPNKESWDLLEPNKKYNIVRNSFENINLSKPDHILIGTIAPLWYLANTVTTTDLKINSLVLIIDNIDPQPTYFQQQIAESIRAVCKSKTWKKHFPSNKINVVLPVRLSTFKRRIGQHGDFENLEHESFYPSDIISYRLKYFFYTREKYFESRTIPHEYQQAMLLRLYALWSHLVDRNSYFRRMIDAIAGTNINHGNWLAHNWCICSNFSYGNVNDITLLKLFFQKIDSEIAAAMLTDFWKSLLRALCACLSGSEKIINSDNRTIQEFAINKAEHFSLSIGELFRDHRILCYPEDNAAIGTRRHLAIKTKEKLRKQLKTCTNSNCADLDTQRNIKELKYYFAKAIDNNEISVYLLKEFQKTVKGNLEIFLNHQCCELTGYDKELAELFSEWINTAFQDVAKNAATLSLKDKPVFFHNDDEIPYSKELIKYAPHISRFNASWDLLKPEGLKRVKEISVENVFSVGDNHFKPVALHILYILYHSTNYCLKIGRLIDTLKYYDYDENIHIVPTLSNLVRVDRRLIFCEVNDYEYGVEKIIKERNMIVYLSNAGKGYYRNLIVTPPYLQWSLQNGKNKEDLTNIVNKITSVFLSLKDIVESEITCLRKLKSSLDAYSKLEETIPSYLCATFDILTRSIEYYMPGLIAHLNKLTPKSSKHANALNLMNTLINQSKEFFDEIIKLYFPFDSAARDHETINKWEFSIGWSEDMIKSRAKIK